MESVIKYILISSVILFPSTHFYIVNYLRRSGSTDLPFLQTIITIFFGNIVTFYKFFYSVHSQNHNPVYTKFILFLSIASAACIPLTVVAVTFLSLWIEI